LTPAQETIMTLAPAVPRHHTAWIHTGAGRPRAVRYAVDGERLVCFGDELPADAIDGSRVSVTVHEIAGGPELAVLNRVVHDVNGDEVDRNAVLELLDHVPLGRDRREVDAALSAHLHRRIVALDA
jgi:hypothetical protein